MNLDPLDHLPIPYPQPLILVQCNAMLDLVRGGGGCYYYTIIILTESVYPPHLYGCLCYRDNVEDEWLAVYLLSELSKQLHHLIIRCGL